LSTPRACHVRGIGPIRFLIGHCSTLV
jgi:hypothetical protein